MLFVCSETMENHFQSASLKQRPQNMSSSDHSHMQPRRLKMTLWGDGLMSPRDDDTAAVDQHAALTSVWAGTDSDIIGTTDWSVHSFGWLFGASRIVSTVFQRNAVSSWWLCNKNKNNPQLVGPVPCLFIYMKFAVRSPLLALHNMCPGCLLLWVILWWLTFPQAASLALVNCFLHVSKTPFDKQPLNNEC